MRWHPWLSLSRAAPRPMPHVCAPSVRTAQSERRKMDALKLGMAAAIGAAAAIYFMAKRRTFPEAAALNGIRDEWQSVHKTSGGRVDRVAFKEHCLKVHSSKLTGASTATFEAFLDRAFDAAVGLMLAPGAPVKTDLGRHCFSCVLQALGMLAGTRLDWAYPLTESMMCAPQMQACSQANTISMQQRATPRHHVAAVPVSQMF